MTIWITADHHFGHDNIIPYCNRPFKDAGHMDEVMIMRWNEVVESGDVVYYIGDLTMGNDAERYVRRLNGGIYFQRGSHDKWMNGDLSRYTGDIWEKHRFIPVIHEIKHNGIYVVMCHYSMRSWARSFHGSVHLYGHFHGRLPDLGRSKDIGVDTNEFYPYNMDYLVRELTKRATHEIRA